MRYKSARKKFIAEMSGRVQAYASAPKAETPPEPSSAT
jgi:hypothetical protein